MHTKPPLTLLRLAAQRLVGPGCASPVAAVEHLLAVQAQDLPAAALAVALRTADGTGDAVRAALDAGQVVRTWPMRGTLHLLAARDAAWMTPLLAPRTATTMARRRVQLGLDAADQRRAGEVAGDVLADGGLRRADLLAAWAAAGVPVHGQRGYHLLAGLAMDGRVVLGPTRGGEQLVVLAEAHLPAPSELERSAALAELALRYFRGHGPATPADLARWAGLSLGQARSAATTAREQLSVLEVGGQEMLFDPAVVERLAAAEESAAGVLLLPPFDELVLGYADRSATLDREHEALVVPGGNGVFRPLVVAAGRVVATWSSPARGREGVALRPFGTLDPAVRQAVARAVSALPSAPDPPLRR